MTHSHTQPAHTQPDWLKVCTTCNRYALSPNAIGEPLAAAVEAAAAEMAAAGRIVFRRVPCLSGCMHPGNIALGAGHKTKIRLNGLRPEDAADLIRLAELYAASPSGEIPEADWPERLKGHLAIIIQPRPPGD